MKEWEVTIPIAGHASVIVEANTEAEAIKKAKKSVTTKDIQEWEVWESCQGNVCYFPTPWDPHAEDIGEVQ